jgi:hypothetical protein
MTMSTASRDNWTMVLRRQRASAIDGKPGNGYSNSFEIVCRDCGDDLGLDYQDVPPRLQRIRGPYRMQAGVTEYEAHIAWHEALGGRDD